MTSLFTAEQIGKSFHLRPVLRGVTFALSPGEIVLLFGRNGCGKTTLLKILAGIMRPEKGTAHLNGRPLFTSASIWRKDMAYLGHRPNLYPSFTAKENLKLSVRLRGQAWDEERFQELLVQYGLAGRDNESIRVYSEGMLQRLGLMRLELASWELALLDEPSSALDVDGVELLSATLASWRSQGRTVFFTSHDLSWGASQAERALLLDKGQIITSLDRPKSENLIPYLSSADRS